MAFRPYILSKNTVVSFSLVLPINILEFITLTNCQFPESPSWPHRGLLTLWGPSTCQGAWSTIGI